MSSNNLANDAPDGQINDASYKSKSKEPIPVVADDEGIEDPVRPERADSDEQLGEPVPQQGSASILIDIDQDEKDAIDKSNIIEERTRGAKPTGTYKEPSDEIKDLE